MSRPSAAHSKQPHPNPRTNLSVLIDGENIAAADFPAVERILVRLGVLKHIRLHAALLDANHKPWLAALRHRPTASFHQPTAATKNATDVSLVIDAMNLVHTDPPDGFCIVSSDSDFVHLAHYLRALGFDVYGFGRANSPPELVAAFTSFYTIDRPQEEQVIQRIRAFLATQLGDDDRARWTSLHAIYAHMRDTEPDFTPSAYGYRTLPLMLRQHEGFEISTKPGTLPGVRAIPE